jgi:branched-chain amino acid transport system permease protein
VTRFLAELWGHRRDLGALWWRIVGTTTRPAVQIISWVLVLVTGGRVDLHATTGLTRERFHALPTWQQRAGKVALGGAIAFLLSTFINVLEHSFGQSVSGSIVTFDAAAYIAFAVVAMIIVPEWRALPELPLRLALPGAVVAGAVGGIVAALATHDVKNGVICSVGLTIAVGAPPWLSGGRRSETLPLLQRRMPIGRKVVPMAALALALTFPFFNQHMFTIPVFGEFPSVETAVYMLVFIMMAVGLNVVVGYAGLLDLGYVAFYAMGAYTAAWFASLQFPQTTLHFLAVGIDTHLPGIHITPWLLFALAGVLTALIGVVIGLPTLRLRGDYLAIVTLGFGEIMPQVARNGNDLGGFNLTGGPQGITPIDSPGFGHSLSSWTHGFLPSNYLTTGSANAFYWTALVLLLFTIFCTIRLRDSRLGRAWVAIREDEVAASAMGVPLMRTKTWAYACGAFFGGIAGAYFAAYKSSTFPQDFYFNISVFILCMVILGGMGNVWGVILGAAFLAYLNQEGLANTGAWLNLHFGTHIDVPEYASGIYGVIIVIVMLIRPQGLIPSARRKRELELGTHDEPAYDVAH